MSFISAPTMVIMSYRSYQGTYQKKKVIKVFFPSTFSQLYFPVDLVSILANEDSHWKKKMTYKCSTSEFPIFIYYNPKEVTLGLVK